MGAGTEAEVKCASYEGHIEKFKNIEKVIDDIQTVNKEQGLEIINIGKITVEALASMKSFHKRMNEVEGQTKAIFELSYSVKGLSENVAVMVGNLQKQEEVVNERFEKQAVAIDARFEKQTEVILSLATKQSEATKAQNEASKIPGNFALKAWWFVIGGIIMKGIDLAFKLWTAGK